MTTPTVLDVAALGVRVEIRKTAAQTDGELVEFDVVGRARGFIAQAHVHAAQSERHEVIEGTMRLVVGGREHLLGPGQAMEVPAGTSHRQLPGDEGHGRVRVQLRPAGRTEEFLQRLAQLSASGAFNRWGYPRPLAGAALVRDFGDVGHASRPPVAVQRAVAGALLRLASSEYLFVDEWDVAAPPDAVFAALADARSYPAWWRPVYLDVEADGPPAVGMRSRQHFKGRLPYHLHTSSRVVALRAAARARGRRRRRSSRSRPLDADRGPTRHARALRLARARRPAAAARPHAAPAAGVPLEPRLGDRPGAGGARAVRPGPRTGTACPAGSR